MHAPTILIGHKASKNKTKTRVHYCLSKEKRINAVLEIQFSLNPFFIGYEFLFKSKTFQIENIEKSKQNSNTLLT